ncbi:hypothetical protein [uncultured Bacteroides sp.]|uniref:hypothetical protein n=1 Tax=uncultured Bacteroides sp. TaxID=162156 RepID=UPI00280B30C5|nr:hypothetical protein [uncultured Bacteroides sp.]
MRKWTYLVAVLLMAGTSTSLLTSCIDNDEPAGITELRGAKAELLRAKAAVEQAEAAIKTAQVKWHEAEAEIKNQEAEQAKLKTDYLSTLYSAKKDSISAQATLYKELLNKKLIAAQQASAEANAAYQKALAEIEAALVGLQESAYAERLKALLSEKTFEYTYTDAAGQSQTIQITGLIELAKELSTAQNDLADLMNDKLLMDYTFNVNAKIAAVEGQIATEEGTLEGMKESLEDYKTIKGTSFEDWQTLYETYEDELEKLINQENDIDLKEKEALRVTAAKKDSLSSANNAKTELKFTVSDKIAEVFQQNITTSSIAEVNDFAITDAEGNVTYPNGITLQKTRDDKATLLSSILTAIEGNILDASAENQMKQKQAQYAALEASYFTADQKGTYDVALKAWSDAKAAYTKNFNDGKYYDADNNAYAIIYKAYQDYLTAIAALDQTEDADEIDAKTEAFRKELGDYLTARKTFDGFVPENAGKALSPATNDTDFTAWQSLPTDKDRFGGDIAGTLTDVPNYGGSYKAYVDACNTIGYEYAINPTDNIVTQAEITYESWEKNVTNYPAPQGTKLYEKAFAAKYNNAYVSNLLNNKAEWDALAKSLEDLKAANQDEINKATLCQNDINTEEAKIKAQFAGEKAKISQQKAGITDIQGIITTTLESAASGTSGYEKAVEKIEEEIIKLEQGGASLTPGTSSTSNPTLTFTTNGSIPGQEAVIESYKKLLEALKSGDYKTEEELWAKQKEDEISRKQDEIKVLQALLDSANKIKDQLMAGLTGGSSTTTPAE